MTQDWIIEEVVHLGVGLRALSRETGLPVHQIESWCHGESPSDWLTPIKLLTLLVRQRAEEWQNV